MDEPLTSGHASELIAVAQFLRACLPFDELSDAQLDQAMASLRVAYHPQGTRFAGAGEPEGLRLLRSGAVDLRDSDNKLLDRLAEGESFHIQGLNAGPRAVVATVIEDALIYRLPDADYQALRTKNRAFDRYFSSQRSRRLRRAARYEAQPHGMLAAVSTVMTESPLTVSTSATVHELAREMAARHVSSAFVVDATKLAGIVTDRDLRTRVLAKGLDGSALVGTVMTADPESIRADQSLFDATLLMTQRGFHHLPVIVDGLPKGIVTTSDLILARRDDPVHLVQHISRQQSVEDLAQLCGGMAELMLAWMSSGVRAQQVSRILTAISDAVTVRLIELVEAQLGAAPAPWAWLAFGSQARGEQLLGADQDNGIVIDDSVQAKDLSWYTALSQQVCDGLARCGYKYCPGGIMATTDAWRVPLTSWKSTVRRWTQTPHNDAVMRVSIFFDIRGIYGELSLARELQLEMLHQASNNTIFQAALAANVLATPPPLGVFRRFLLERDGGHRDTVDIKKRGILPVTEIARLHALAHRVDSVNTDERLQSLARGKHLSIVDSRNLTDALHFIQRLRMQHQAQQVRDGVPVDNHINPRALPRLAKAQLRDAFTIIEEAQSGLRQTYRAGLG